MEINLTSFIFDLEDDLFFNHKHFYTQILKIDFNSSIYRSLDKIHEHFYSSEGPSNE